MLNDMQPRMKNTIIVSVAVVLVTLICGYLVFFFLPGRIEKAQSLNESLSSKIGSLREIGKEYYHVQELLQQKEEKLLVMNKVINSEVTPADTYEYLNNLLDFTGFVDFDMRFQGSKNVASYGYNVYQIKGEGTFDRIYKFISYIERGPQIYRIQKMSLRSRDAEKSLAREPIIPFNMQVWAYYANLEDLPAPRISLESVVIDNIKDPFSPETGGVEVAPPARRSAPGKSSKPARAPNPEGLVEVDRSKLQAIVLGKAMVVDQNGKMQTLRQGDTVFQGTLSKIDQANNLIEFTLDSGGSTRTYVLRMKF